MLLLWRRTDFVLQWPVFQPQKQQLVHVECWQSAPFLEMGVKRSLFNVPMFTNTELMKAGPHLLNYVCSITQSTSAITAFLCFWLPQQCLCREGKTHILFFGCFIFLHKALNETWLPRYKHVNVILVMTLQIHEQCFEVCASNCSFKWNRSRAVGKEFNVLLNVNKKIRCSFWLEMIWRTFHIMWLYRDMRNICYWSIWI